jgi:hypothetical protein
VIACRRSWSQKVVMSVVQNGCQGNVGGSKSRKKCTCLARTRAEMFSRAVSCKVGQSEGGMYESLIQICFTSRSLACSFRKIWPATSTSLYKFTTSCLLHNSWTHSPSAKTTPHPDLTLTHPNYRYHHQTSTCRTILPLLTRCFPMEKKNAFFAYS